MERLANLKEGEKFKLFKESPINWTVIETNPKEYADSYRCKGGKITAPFNKNLMVWK